MYGIKNTENVIIFYVMTSFSNDIIFLCKNFSSSINNTYGRIIISNYYDTNQLQTFTNLQIKR